MERLTHERLNGIRNGYWSPNKKQELVDRLAAYENTNLDPEQVKHVKETAKKYLLEKAQGKVGGWIPVEERSPAGYERIGYDKQGNKYMQRLEIAYMTDTIEYVHGYYDGYKWMDKRHDIIENVVAWKIHKPYRPERSRE